MRVACGCRWFYHLCVGAPGVFVSMGHTGYPHPVRAVCGCSDIAVCVGILEKERLGVYSGSHSGTRRGLFPGAVHAYRYSRGEIQLVSASGSGVELHRAFTECDPTEKNGKDK